MFLLSTAGFCHVSNLCQHLAAKRFLKSPLLVHTIEHSEALHPHCFFFYLFGIQKWSQSSRKASYKWRAHCALCCLILNHRISSKFHRSEILFQGSIWCSDNSRAARFWGWCLQRLIRTCGHSFNNKPICMHIKYTCTYVNCYWTLTKRRDFEGGV